MLLLVKTTVSTVVSQNKVQKHLTQHHDAAYGLINIQNQLHHKRFDTDLKQHHAAYAYIVYSQTSL